MKTLFKMLCSLLLAAFFAGVLIVVIGSAWLEPLSHATHAVLQIDDDAFSASAWQGGDWLVALAAVAGVVLVVMLALLIVPVALLLPLLIVALGLGVAVFAVVGVVAMLVSPLLLVGWIAWRLLRSEQPRAAAPAARIPA